MVLEGLNQGRLPHDCKDAGGRVTQEQLPKDVAVEQAGQKLFLTIFCMLCHPWQPDGNFLRALI